jgi:hypothetical protein
MTGPEFYLAPTRDATTFRELRYQLHWEMIEHLAPTRGATTFRERALARNVVASLVDARLIHLLL